MTTARNDITGNALRSRPPSDKYNEGWERIFGKKKKREKGGVNGRRPAEAGRGAFYSADGTARRSCSDRPQPNLQEDWP